MIYNKREYSEMENKEHTLCVSYYFLRAYGDNVFTVEDISLPFVSMPEIQVTRIKNTRPSNVGEPELYSNESESNVTGTTRKWKNTQSVQTEYINIDENNLINVFRYMPVKQKATFIEECILSNRQEALKAWCLDTLYAHINIDIGINSSEIEEHKKCANIFHLLLYRDLDSSYTSSNPVPKKPMGKTRMLVHSPRNSNVSEYYSWVTVTDLAVEQRILDEYRILAHGLISYYDENYPIYGMISNY